MPNLAASPRSLSLVLFLSIQIGRQRKSSGRERKVLGHAIKTQSSLTSASRRRLTFAKWLVYVYCPNES